MSLVQRAKPGRIAQRRLDHHRIRRHNHTPTSSCCARTFAIATAPPNGAGHHREPGARCDVNVRKRMRNRKRTLIGLSALLAAGVAACGGSTSSGTSGSTGSGRTNSGSGAIWSNLTRVTVSAVQPSVNQPPGDRPHRVVFTTPQQLRTVTRALNADHIQRASHSTSDNGCAGGIQIAIVIVQKGGKTTRLGAYRCGNTTTGDIAGNVNGFLTRTGVSVP
jgi:hypothetical protein